jgi:hypothetical protein
LFTKLSSEELSKTSSVQSILFCKSDGRLHDLGSGAWHLIDGVGWTTTVSLMSDDRVEREVTATKI